MRHIENENEWGALGLLGRHPGRSSVPFAPGLDIIVQLNMAAPTWMCRHNNSYCDNAGNNPMAAQQAAKRSTAGVPAQATNSHSLVLYVLLGDHSEQDNVQGQEWAKLQA